MGIHGTLCPWFGDYKECSYKNRVKGAEDYKKAKRLVKARRILQHLTATQNPKDGGRNYDYMARNLTIFRRYANSRWARLVAAIGVSYGVIANTNLRNHRFNVNNQIKHLTCNKL